MTEERKEYERARNAAIKNGTWKPRVKMTPEERDAKKKESNKASYAKIKLARPERAKLTPEEKRERKIAGQQRWREANKEKIKTDREANKEREANKAPFNIVYCIPDYDGKGGHYAGVTNSVYRRMGQHKRKGILNTENWFILDVVIDRGEALMSESRFHAQGYDGAGGWRNKK